MGKYEEIYRRLREKYTDEEIAESMLIPAELTEEEEQKARREFAEFRMKRRSEMTGKEKIFSGLLRIRYQMKSYIENKEYDEGQSVSKYLIDYSEVTGKNQKELAADIDVHPSRLSRILNGKERIGKSVAYRLEIHSGSLIPAILWWKLVQKEIEQEIKTEKEERRQEGKRVKNIVYQE